MSKQTSVVFLAVLAASFFSAAMAQKAESTAKPTTIVGDKWDALRALPDWSGAWTQTSASFSRLFGDSTDNDMGRVPLRPEYRALRKQRSESREGPGNLPKGWPAGVPGILTHNATFEFLYTPGQVTMLFENCEIRRIHTDGRAHLPEAEMDFGFAGDSIGHWEGQTLVVDTTGISLRAELFQNNGINVTRQTRVVERISLATPNSLQIETTVTDPAVFTAPYIYKRDYERVDLPLTDGGCGPTNRDTDLEVDLTPPA